MKGPISEFIHLLHMTEQYVASSPDRYGEDLRVFLHRFREKRAHPIFERCERLNAKRFVLSLVGLTNVGKSTLFEALLGHKVAPSRNAPATAVPVEYEYGFQWAIIEPSRLSHRVRRKEYDNVDELARVLEGKVFDVGNQVSNEQRGTECIIVRGPMQMLKSGVVLADTPGFGAAQSASSRQSHTEVLVNYLEKNVTEVMFCVSSGNAMISNDEMELFQCIEPLCSTIIVTKWNPDVEKHESLIERYREKFEDVFPFCRFMFVEAKWAIEGQNASGIDELRALIDKRATPDKRMGAVAVEIQSAWEDLHELAKEPLSRAGLHKIPWHRAALPNFLNAAKDHNIEIIHTS